LRKSSRKIRKDIGKEISEIFLIYCNGSLFSNIKIISNHGAKKSTLRRKRICNYW
jgi:hypothetical protein